MNIFRNRIQLIFEFSRYVLVGGLAFIADFGVLYILKERFLPNEWYSLYLATGLGFAAGLLINYILSVNFVFTSVRGTKVGKSFRDFTVFSLIGIIGLFLTELGMFLGTKGLELNYLFVKIIVTFIVLLWNYSARKILVFSKKGL
ncbi:GtrA family protein [Desulfitobacterium sp. Sab5]|uniref:GtrA family protein n=1 Tax=Desulfitobacterium nosdiversum TaxID=3375356 RepID=UPI003CF01602